MRNILIILFILSSFTKTIAQEIDLEFIKSISPYNNFKYDTVPYKVLNKLLIAYFYFNTDEDAAITFGFSSDFHALLAKYGIETDFTIWDASSFKKKFN